MFTDNDYGKYLDRKIASLFKGMTNADYRAAADKTDYSDVTIRSIVSGKRKLLKSNAKCIIELAKILRNKNNQLDKLIDDNER